MTLLDTDRLIIRNFRPDDWPALHRMIGQYQASEYAAFDRPWPTSEEEIRNITAWFASGDDFLAVCLKEAGQFVGFVSLNPEQDGDSQA
jgi:RimJ/RimL family protein N-acetyltransferase